MRYFLHLAYDGTRYCGWQVQANAPSVQETINKALEKLLGHHIKSMGCGRTDTGVHAKDFYMHFDTENPAVANKANFLFRLNCVLPEDISIYRIIDVEEKAHTRFDATERTYEYYIYFNKSPFIHKYATYQGFYQIDWQKVIEATTFLKGIEDFTSLCLPSIDFKTNICYIKHAAWDILPAHHMVLKPFSETDVYPAFNGGELAPGSVARFTITSNRFLRGMVRKIVGTALMVGRGKIDPQVYRDVVASKGAFKIHYLAPPHGLFLSKVKYPYL